MKRLSIVLAISAVMLMAFAGSAYANFGPHGGYALDTDACAGCHRAHTSFSTLTWNDGVDDRSALLVSSASTMTEFCNACHGDNAPGASTNVQSGVFDAGPSGDKTVGVTGGSVMYLTNSTAGAPLNGGSFSASVSSMHDMDKGSVTDPMWGAANSAPTGTNLTCTGCHDVHGSSNYRLLKDTVNGHTVGGYAVDGVTPQPYVFSSETNYPSGGWLKHAPGAAQMQAYRPNYTDAQYFFASGTGGYATAQRSMSTWCSACHEEYDNNTSVYNYGAYESNGTITRDGNGQLQVAGATAFVGAKTRHRHPVNTTPASANIAFGFGSNAVTDSVLPLEKTTASAGDAVGAYRLTDYMGCLTCHRAHGTTATMSGWANSRIKYNASGVNTWSVEPTTVAPAGVNPNVSSALLRADNRGVCERCHNK